MAVLSESQFELDGVVFGRGRPIEVGDFVWGGPEIEDGDTNLPGQDGTVFGRDTWGGALLTWELASAGTYTAAEARAAWRELAAVWSSRAVRASPRAVMQLRLRIHGGDTVVAYGRPRRLEAGNTALITAGFVEYAADFRTADSTFYSDTEHSLSLDLVADAGGGVTWPVTWPIVWAASGERQDAVIVSGDAPTWPIITIRGPVAQPSLELVGTDRSLRLDTTLAIDETVTIDTRPWARTVRRQDGASMAGALRGASLAEFRLPVGSTVIAYRGTDMSGQSTATVAWRDAYETP